MTRNSCVVQLSSCSHHLHGLSPIYIKKICITIIHTMPLVGPVFGHNITPHFHPLTGVGHQVDGMLLIGEHWHNFSYLWDEIFYCRDNIWPLSFHQALWCSAVKEDHFLTRNIEPRHQMTWTAVDLLLRPVILGSFFTHSAISDELGSRSLQACSKIPLRSELLSDQIGFPCQLYLISGAARWKRLPGIWVTKWRYWNTILQFLNLDILLCPHPS